MLIFTRYDESVNSLFLKSIRSFASNFQNANLCNLVIITESQISSKIIIELNLLFKATILLKPKISLPTFIEKPNNVAMLRFIDVLMNYSAYDRIYIDPTIIYVSQFLTSNTSFIFYKDHTGNISTKSAFLKAGPDICSVVSIFKKGQAISTLTNLEFTFIVSNNSKIIKKLAPTAIANGSKLDSVNFVNLSKFSILGIDVETFEFSSLSKVSYIIRELDNKQKRALSLSKIIKPKNSTFLTVIPAEPAVNFSKITKTVDSEIPTIKSVERISKHGPLECIIVRPSVYNPFESVKKMILERFSKLPEHNDTLVILGYNVGCNIKNYRDQYPGWKIVIYQLEQVCDNLSLWYNINSSILGVRDRTIAIKKMLTECDEIWEYDLDNMNFLINEGFTNIKHVPLAYCEALVRNTNASKTIDVLFYGSVNSRRAAYLEELANYFTLVIFAPAEDCLKYKDFNFGKYMKDPKFNDDLFNYISKAKVVVNIHYYESHLQEQVRIFELLINDVIVVSEKSRKNYFGDLIIEVDNVTDMIYKISNILASTITISQISNRFKNLENLLPIRIGAAYNTFYGFDIIEKSIDSIRNYVDYIVIVHQTSGLNGQTELPGTANKIKKLLKHKKIDEVVYLDFQENCNMQSFILEKRNLGLQKCLNANCNIIMPMDTDERYEMKKFYPELIKMYYDAIDTLYSPIRSYYYDEYHWFTDTYYVASAIRISKLKKFEITKSSVLVDPVRKMKEGVYRITDEPMHHYTYLKDSFINKVNRNIASTDPNIKINMLKVLEDLTNWESGKPATVFVNDLQNNGNVILSSIHLNTSNSL